MKNFKTVLYSLIVSGAYLTSAFAGDVPLSLSRAQSQLIEHSAPTHKASPNETIDINYAHELIQLFKEYDYEIPAKGHSECSFEVPRLYITSLPHDLNRKSIDTKKSLFLKSLLPLILEENEKITLERKALLTLMAQKKAGLPFSSAQRGWVEKLAKKYKVKGHSLEELKNRVDVIPVSLALAQAVVETGWGTSMAAKKKNSPFGVMVRNRVKTYEDLKESVSEYMLTINSNMAYRAMRDIRIKMREEGKEFCSLKLAGGLQRYSVLGLLYVRKIQNVIRSNDLSRFDSAQLA